jgi:hypothetical protein
VIKDVEISENVLKSILDQMGLELRQVTNVSIGVHEVSVDFYALNDKGMKYKIGDDIARGIMTAKIRWTKDAPDLDQVKADIRQYLGPGWEPVQ